jgi:hypothetical protein
MALPGSRFARVALLLAARAPIQNGNVSARAVLVEGLQRATSQEGRHGLASESEGPSTSKQVGSAAWWCHTKKQLFVWPLLAPRGHAEPASLRCKLRTHSIALLPDGVQVKELERQNELLQKELEELRRKMQSTAAPPGQVLPPRQRHCRCSLAECPMA